MIEVNAILFSVLLEFSAVSAFLLILLLVLKLLGRRRSRQAAQALVTAFTESAEARTRANRDLLVRQAALEGEALETELKTLAQREAEFFQHWMTAFVRRDGARLAAANASLQDLLGRYRGEEVKAVVESNEAELATITDLKSRLATKEATLSRLQKENDKLQRDLLQSRQDIDSMMEEYSAMFEGGIHEQERRERKKESLKHRVEDSDHDDEVIDAAVAVLADDETMPDQDKPAVAADAEAEAEVDVLDLDAVELDDIDLDAADELSQASPAEAMEPAVAEAAPVTPDAPDTEAHGAALDDQEDLAAAWEAELAAAGGQGDKAEAVEDEFERALREASGQ